MIKQLFLLSILAGVASATIFGPNVLSDFGANQTCIDSTSYPGKRCFYTFIPDCASKDAPLVFDIHGFGSSPLYSSYYTGWIYKAIENCFVLVMPSGNIELPATSGESDSCWAIPNGLTNANGTETLPCCCGTSAGITDAEVTDDTTFLRNVAVSVIQDVVPKESSNKVTIDSKRIYMGGHSNGCIASIAMGTVHSDLVAGVCCHVGVAQTSFPPSYQPTPMWIAHGASDPEIRYEGFSDYGETGYSLLGAQATHDVIAEANGCTQSKTINVTGSDNIVSRYISDGCVNGATVELLTLDDVGHFPFLGFDEIEDGTVLTKVDTTQLAWEFCSQHSLEVEPELVLVTPSDPDVTSHASISYGTTSKSTQLLLLAVLFMVLRE